MACRAQERGGENGSYVSVLSKKKEGERGEGGTSPFMSALSDLAREFRFHSGCDGQIWENFHS